MSEATEKLDIRVTEVEDMIRHGQALFEEHWREMQPDDGDLDIDWAAFKFLEAENRLVVLSAWMMDNGPIGYVVGIDSPDLFRVGCTVMTVAAGPFVAQAHRRSGAGLKLLRAIDKLAKKRGCSDVKAHAKPGTALQYVLDARQSFDVEEIVYRKVL